MHMSSDRNNCILEKDLFKEVEIKVTKVANSINIWGLFSFFSLIKKKLI